METAQQPAYRQTIFDRKMGIHADELLFRSGLQHCSNVNPSLDGKGPTGQALRYHDR